MSQKPYEGYILVNSHTYKFNPPILGLFPHSLLQNSTPKPFQKFSEASNIPRIYEERTSKNCHPKYLIYCIFPKILPNVQRRSYIFLHPWDLRILVIIIKSVFFFSKKTYFFCQISVRNKRNISHRMGVKLGPCLQCLCPQSSLICKQNLGWKSWCCHSSHYKWQLWRVARVVTICTI